MHIAMGVLAKNLLYRNGIGQRPSRTVTDGTGKHAKEGKLAKSSRVTQGSRRQQRAQTDKKPTRGLWSGFMMGLGAITMLGSPDFNPPRYAGKGIRGDWQAVGKDIQGAMRKLNEHQKA
jgi:hypothetical protein